MSYLEASYIKPPKQEQFSESSPADDLALLQTKIDALEIEMLSTEGMSHLPSSWYDHVVPDDIELKLENPADVARYIELQTRFAALAEQLYAAPSSEPVRPVSTAKLFTTATSLLSPEQIAKVVVAESDDGSVRAALLEVLATKPDEETLEIIQQTFGLEKLTQLFAIKGKPYADAVHEQLRDPEVLSAIETVLHPMNSDGSFPESAIVRQSLVEQVLKDSYGLSETEVRDYGFSTVHGYETEQIIDLFKRLDHFGIDRLRAITKATGIIGIESYSIAQLERMERLVADPEEFAEELRSHDVSVVLINRYNSDNSLMSKLAETFDDTNGSARTLFFEIANPTDIYRTFAELQKTGIKPATVAIAAHGSAGGFVLKDDRNPNAKKVRWLVTDGKKATAVENASFAESGRDQINTGMHEMQGLARLVEDYMQPSRSIDDDPADSGRKKIILVTCQMAAETPQFDLDEDGNKVQIGLESVVSQLGKDLAASGVQSSVDIYGAVESIQVLPTAKGVRLASSPTSFGGEREAAVATRVQLDAGTIHVEVVDEITLRA